LALRFSIVLFVIGQAIPLFNSQIATTKLALVLCSCSTLGLGLTILWREIISPIRERSQQIINMREVAQTVSARTDLEELLADITNQAALWLHADGAAIFLTGSNEECKLVAMWQLPQSYSNHVVRIGEGIVGRSIQTGQTLIREASDADYADMVQSSFPDGTELFGCVMSSPFNDKQNLAGAIVVISNRQGKVFSEDDRVLLEIMASEVSIGIAYSQINHEIEGSRRNLEHVLDTTGNPIVTVNELGAIQYANKTARDLQGKGQSLVPPDWKANPKRQIWYEQKIETRYYNCQSIELEGRTPLEWLIVYNDITREKEITSLRDDVIRLASHDIKNPLQGAIANLELLQDDLLNTPNPEVQISLRELDTQLRRIEEITTTILGSKQQFVNEVHAISSILTDATDAMRGQASSRQHEMILLKPDDFTFIKGSRDQLKRAFMNLLDNAIKYSPDGSKIRVSTYQDNDHIIIEFHDTGIGIPLSIQSKIFSPFFRGEEHGQQSTHSTGSGVGLNIVKGIIENHGGNIWFTSKEQEGTTFFVSLPVNQRLEPTERF
jgi:signal transduction histidine kinase